jgi:hypothetical protein
MCAVPCDWSSIGSAQIVARQIDATGTYGEAERPGVHIRTFVRSFRRLVAVVRQSLSGERQRSARRDESHRIARIRSMIVRGAQRAGRWRARAVGLGSLRFPVVGVGGSLR